MNIPAGVLDGSKVELSEYGEYFLEFLREKNIPHVNMDKIREVCSQLEKDHEGRERLTGEFREYHSHLYETAKLYIEEGGKNITEEGIIISLRHDDIEDLKGKVQFMDIKESDGSITAICIQALSKPTTLDKSEEAKEKRDSCYYPNFHDLQKLQEFIQKIALENNIELTTKKIGELARLVAIIKICDRIHNLRTMPETYPEQKRERKIKQTEKHFISLSQSLGLPSLRDKLVKALIYGHRTQRKIRTGYSLRTH